MKNLSAYLDDFIKEEDGTYFEHCKGKISCEKINKKTRKKSFKDEGFENPYKPKKNKSKEYNK